MLYFTTALENQLEKNQDTCETEYIVYDMDWTKSRFPVTALFLPA